MYPVDNLLLDCCNDPVAPVRLANWFAAAPQMDKPDGLFSVTPHKSSRSSVRETDNLPRNALRALLRDRARAEGPEHARGRDAARARVLLHREGRDPRRGAGDPWRAVRLADRGAGRALYGRRGRGAL